MPVFTYVLVGIGAYLLGSIPFGFVLVRLFRHEDIRERGSGNIGATNVVRSGARGLGALTFLLDACKGYAAVWLAGVFAAHMAVRTGAGQGLAASLGSSLGSGLRSGLAAGGAGSLLVQNAAALAALCAILGHVYPVWLNFKGGKGVATAFGVFLALSWGAALAALAVFVLVFVASRYVSAASIAASVTLPVFALLLPHPPYGPCMIAVLLLAPVIVIGKHHRNIVRLARGTEYRFGRKDTAEA
jgi:glycerol-3-phosphate acyltransferase PlsY